MSLVKITLTFTFSFFSNGLVRYQCPSWPSLGSITHFESYQSFEQNMRYFLRMNMFSIDDDESPFYMTPETFWLHQASCPRFDKTILELPVNAIIREKFNQDQTLFPITVYYLISLEYDEFYVLWIPLIEQYIQVKRSDDAAFQKELIHNEIKKAVYGYTKGDWKSLLLEIGRITSFDVKQFTFEMPSPFKQFEHDYDFIRYRHELFCDSLTALDKSDSSRFSQITGMEEQAERMKESLFLEQPISVLIVGEPGVGKTSLWNYFSRICIQNDCPCYYTTPIILGGIDPCDFDSQPDTRLENVVAFARKKHGVYYLGNLWELAQVGTYFKHPISLADYLVPHLEKKELGVVVECNNEQFAELEKSKPELIQLFDVIKLDPANSALTNEILRKNAKNYSNIKISDEALSTISQLYQKYSAYENLPGAAVKFLDLLLSKNVCIGKKEINKSDVIDFFTLQTGLPKFLLDPAIPFDKSEAKNFFTSRVIGQDGTFDKDGNDNNDVNAVDTIVELLETVKTGLTRQTGPIATLLFVGPTGVGKTEMAKALAEYLYSDPSRMIRLDMSEYSDPATAGRLINDLNDGEGILTSQVRAQPFGIVLLDEFEKAHPCVFDMFLQVMGEGRLTDAQGRLAVFTNCVIILTSNLGMDTYGKSTLAMKQSQQYSTQKHFIESVAKHVRPELLNRIDRIVPFSPLSKPVLRQILNLEFESVNRRLGVQWRHLNISYEESVIDKLVELGYSPQFGARPLRRTVEMYILHPLAEAMAKRNANLPYDVHFSLPEKKIHVSAHSVKPEKLFSITVKSTSQDLDSDLPAVSAKQTAEQMQKYRSFVQNVDSVYNCDFLERLRSDVLYQDLLLQSSIPDLKPSVSQQMLMKQKSNKDILSRLHQIRKKALSLENDMVFDYLTSKERFARRVSETQSSEGELADVEKQWIDLLKDLFFYKHEIKKNSSYIAYIIGDSPSILLFFDLLFKALIPKGSLKESCLFNKNASKIQKYLDNYCTSASTYNWIDAEGVFHFENNKEKFRRLSQFPEHLISENDSHKRESKQSSSTPSFEYLIQEYNPDIMEDVFKDDAPDLGYNALILETSDRYSIALLKSLEGFHSLRGIETIEKNDEKNGKNGGKKISRVTKRSAFIDVYPGEQCQNKLPDGVRWTQLDGSDSAFQFRFASSSLPKEYSSGKVFSFSCQQERSNRIPFEINSLKSYFSNYVVNYIYNDLLEKDK